MKTFLYIRVSVSRCIKNFSEQLCCLHLGPAGLHELDVARRGRLVQHRVDGRPARRGLALDVVGLVRHLRNPLDPPNDHQAGQNRHDHPEHPLVLRKHTLTTTRHRHQLRRRLIHLENVTAPERRKNTENRKEEDLINIIIIIISSLTFSFPFTAYLPKKMISFSSHS